jgi:hypothetical protein
MISIAEMQVYSESYLGRASRNQTITIRNSSLAIFRQMGGLVEQFVVNAQMILYHTMSTEKIEGALATGDA